MPDEKNQTSHCRLCQWKALMTPGRAMVKVVCLTALKTGSSSRMTSIRRPRSSACTVSTFRTTPSITETLPPLSLAPRAVPETPGPVAHGAARIKSAGRPLPFWRAAIRATFALTGAFCYPEAMLESLREVVRYRSLLRNLVARDLKVRYKRSALGILWTMLNPLLLMIIFTIVFAQIFRVTVDHFTVYFLSAFVLWNFFAQATSWSTACLLSYGPLIKKIYLPKSIFVIATVLAGTVNLLISLVPLALIMLCVGHPFSPALAFLPVPIFLATLFSLGLSLALAPLCVMFADIVQIYAVVLTAWMYLTPIIYPLNALPDHYRRLILANPMTHLVEAFRTPIYQGAIPSLHVMISASVAAVGTLVIGWVIFEHYSDRVAYYV